MYSFWFRAAVRAALEYEKSPHAGPQVSLAGEKVGAGAEIRNAPFVDDFFSRFYVFRRPGVEAKQPLGEGNKPKGAFLLISPLFKTHLHVNQGFIRHFALLRAQPQGSNE